jgi:16S rRNA (adenine1518-N6/adenine1519-N6)-dimethyltransferase
MNETQFPWRPRRRFGQNFLTQPEIARRIVALAHLDGAQTVLEIGPGRGALTALIAVAVQRLILVEIDRDLAAALRQRFTAPHLQILEADILRVDLAALLTDAAPVTVIANLPYNVSTPVLLQLLDTSHLYRRLVLMLQREVAERLCAAPGTKAYGTLSVVVQLSCRAEVAFTVPAGAFRPAPKVESAVVVLEPHHPPPLVPRQRQALRRLLRTTFSQRRKQLANSLRALSEDPRGLLAALGIDPQRRPETLSPGDFLRLAEALDTNAADSP